MQGPGPHPIKSGDQVSLQCCGKGIHIKPQGGAFSSRSPQRQSQRNEENQDLWMSTLGVVQLLYTILFSSGNTRNANVHNQIG